MNDKSLSWLVAKAAFWAVLAVVAYFAHCYYSYEAGKTIGNIISK